MANLSERTRKQQVLDYLQRHRNEWIDGPSLATPEVGGSEGLKRLRELRLEGLPIQTRKHPDPSRDIWQYRLTDAAEGVRGADTPVPARSPDPVDRGEQSRPPKIVESKFTERPARLEFGTAIPCPRCEGRKVSIDPITKKRGDCTRCNGIGIVPVPRYE